MTWRIKTRVDAMEDMNNPQTLNNMTLLTTWEPGNSMTGFIQKIEIQDRTQLYILCHFEDHPPTELKQDEDLHWLYTLEDGEKLTLVQLYDISEDKGSLTFKKPEQGPFIDYIGKLFKQMTIRTCENDSEDPTDDYAFKLLQSLHGKEPDYGYEHPPQYDDKEDFENILKALDMIREAVQKNINQIPE